MKILFDPLMRHNLQPNMVSDYQSDMVFHGLRQLYGEDIIDINRMWWMYKKDRDKKLDDFSKIWGKGFTIYGLLPNDENINRDLRNIKDFDIVIIPIHHTMNHQDNELLSVIRKYNNAGFSRNQIVVIDGWDRSHICIEATKKTIYFKRELSIEQYNQLSVHPISFAIPKQKCIPITITYNKSFDFAPLIPAMHSWGNTEHLNTYIYNNETSYYHDYETSFFAYTCCKAGWDTLRHYEILANGCIPWFTDIEKCPKTILTTLPKDLLIAAKKIRGVIPGTTEPYDPNKNTYLGDTRKILPGSQRGKIDLNIFDIGKYNSIRLELLKYTHKYLTTEALAKGIINVIKEQNR